MSFDLIEYYKALNGGSALDRDTWHINYDKRHAFSVSSDADGYNPSAPGMFVPPSEQATKNVTNFSDLLGQKIDNTKITTGDDGTEQVELELEDRIVTIIVDQSGSMTWNDSDNLRHDIAKDLIDKIDINYPGDIRYNLIAYGAKFISVLFFGLIDTEGVDPYNIDTLTAMFTADEEANYDGIRVVRSTEGYPTSSVSGDIISDGFFNKILESDLTEGQTYYYTIFTYDKDYRFSDGINIKVVPRDRVVPRGISLFRTMVDTDDLSLGQPFSGSGLIRDSNTIGIWHMDEGEGRYLYDFSDSGVVLTNISEETTWLGSQFVPSGISGVVLNGANGCFNGIDSNNAFRKTWAAGDTAITIGAWICPYETDETGFIFTRNREAATMEYNYIFAVESDGTLFFDYGDSIYTPSTITVNYYEWQYVSVTYDGNNVTYRINNVSETVPYSVPLDSDTNTYYISIAGDHLGGDSFRGKITEVSVHNTNRSNSYLTSQLVENSITDENGNEVDTEYIGIKDDNEDRLVVLNYEIPEDYNFSGGEVIIVKNEKHIPSWEEDGTIIYQESASPGIHFVSDSDDFVLGETYYYRIFSKNSLGNVSFSSDSPSLEVSIPISDTDDYFVELLSPIPSPEEPIDGQLVTPGNEKIYLRWRQATSIDSRISRVKIYYSRYPYPNVSINGGDANQLVFTGSPTDDKFVHRNLTNDIPAYYTIVNVDKYGRVSDYYATGIQVDGQDHLQAATTPYSSADEGTIPLVDIENVGYEIVDSNQITLGWDQPVKSPEDVSAYFDQTVLLYASITDEFGAQMPEGALIKMYINANISKESQAEDVFDFGGVVEFENIEAYDFFVTRTDAGFMKATLRMTNNTRIISQIQEASFTIQLKAYIPKTGGYVAPNTDTASTDPVSEYVSIIEGLIGEIEGETEVASSNNIFEYYSKPITVNFTNPWEITLESRDEGQVVYQQCYIIEADPITKENVLRNPKEKFYGVHMKSSTPFVARAKVTYKGEPIERGDLQVSVWDADFSNLCAGASDDNVWGVEGDKLQVSNIVSPPDGIMSVVQGVERGIGDTGDPVDESISYVDIPLYAPDSPHAVKLFVKGVKSGYSSVKSLYILFQSILRMSLSAASPEEDGQDVREQIVDVFAVHPDYPNWETSDYASSLITPVDDNSIVQWEIQNIDGNIVRTIYSTDNVPISNGVYSYTRNGVARNVFFGPILTDDKGIDESHIIISKIVYNGIATEAQAQVNLSRPPTEYTKLGARFLMEVDGGWVNIGTDRERWDGVGWLNSDSYPLLSDGISYRRIKIHRDPANSDFGSTNAFTTCDSQLMQLSSGQIVQIVIGDDNIEILHGDITEETDPYTGEHYLSIGEEGFIDNGSAFVELNDEDVSDVTYFYIRANKFVPGAGYIDTNYLIDDDPINDCLQLKPSRGLFLRDLPEWNPYFTISGTTTLFVNDQPLVLRGGGNFRHGIPPCPICLSEPLFMAVVWRRVTNYYYSPELGDPSNDFILPVITEVENNNFRDADYKTIVNHDSDVDIRVKVQWRGGNVPNDTPVYVVIGDKTSNTLFIAGSNIYYTSTDSEEGYSYADVRIVARRPPDTTTTERIEIYVDYDENGKTERHIRQNFYLTLDVKDIIIEIPVVVEPDPSLVVEPPEVTPFSGTLMRYDITDDEWTSLESMSENRGNAFCGEVNGKIYVMGGLKNNSLNIASTTEEYNIATDSWQNKKVMPNPRFGGMSITVDNDIYIMGGFMVDSNTQNLSVTNIVEVYHADTNVWEPKEHMPIQFEGRAFQEDLKSAFGAAQHVIINAKNYIYIVGGIQEAVITSTTFKINNYNKRILRYCIEDNVWKSSSILRSNESSTYQRISPLTLTIDDKLIVFGGAIESGDIFSYPSDDFYINIEEIFTNTPTGEYWINFGSGLFGSFPVPKFQSAMMRFDDNPSVDTTSEYYIFGGRNSDADSLDIVENLSVVSGAISYNSSYNDDASLMLSPLPFAKHGASAVYSDANGSSCAYVVGGYTSSQPNTFVDISFDI